MRKITGRKLTNLPRIVVKANLAWINQLDHLDDYCLLTMTILLEISILEDNC